MRILLAVLAIILFPSLSLAQALSGADVALQVRSALAQADIKAEPIIAKQRRYYACATDLKIVPRIPERWDALSVECEVPVPWSIIVRTKGQTWADGAAPDDQAAQQGVKTSVVVLTHSARKGEVLSRAMLAIKELSNTIAPGFYINPDNLVGRRMARSLTAGVPIRARHLELPWAIESGQNVLIEYDVGGVFVSMAGVALENGQLTDLISVKNSSSGKILQGFVSGPKKITISANMK